MRLDKYLSNMKYGSRKDIKSYCRSKRIILNDEIIKDPSVKIDLTKDILLFDDKVVKLIDKVYLILNKPSGYVSATKDNLHKTVIDLLPEEYRVLNLSIAGRLDIDTEGLVLITNDGNFVHKIISPKKKVDKKYYVKTKEILKANDTNKLLNGVIIKDKVGNDYETQPCNIEIISDYECFITIYEGKFHQVKRMFKSIDNEVVFLKRLSVGEYTLEDLKIGEFKEIEVI